jgi:outer membrane protein assembly factor BamB
VGRYKRRYHSACRGVDEVKLPICIILLPVASLAQWTTFGADPQRTSWAHTESILNKDNVATLELKWKLRLDNVPKELTSLTPPLVVDQVKTERGIKEYVIVGGSSDNLYAIDADSGKLAWKKTFTASASPTGQPNTLCPFALNAAPVIQGGRSKTIYTISSDGRLHALNASNGEDRFAPAPFVPAFSKNWSLNLADGILYTAVGQRCNGVPSGVYSLDLNKPDHPVHSFQAGRPGIWGRAGVAVSAGTGTVFAETGDGAFKPEEGQFADAFVALSPGNLKLTDYYTPSNREWITRKDLDMGCMSPVVFPFQGKEYVAGGGKEGRLFLLDARSLGGETHAKPLLRTDLLTNEDVAYAAHGFWGSFATWEDLKQVRWLFAPAWGPPHPAAPAFPVSYGATPHGSVMAFRVEAKDGSPALTPAWNSRDLNVPEPPIIANGVVFALSSGEDVGQADSAGNSLGTAERVKASTHAILYALDSETGKELFSSKEIISSFTHLGGIAVSNGRIFVTTYDGTVYAFGVKNEER